METPAWIQAVQQTIESSVRIESKNLHTGIRPRYAWMQSLRRSRIHTNRRLHTNLDDAVGHLDCRAPMRDDDSRDWQRLHSAVNGSFVVVVEVTRRLVEQ